MRRLRVLLLALRESFWLIPAIALVLAVVLGIALVELDAGLEFPFAAQRSIEQDAAFGIQQLVDIVALAFEPLLHHARNSPEALAALARAATPHRRQFLRRHLQLVGALSAA